MGNQPNRGPADGYLASLAVILVAAAVPVLLAMARTAGQSWVMTVAFAAFVGGGAVVCFGRLARRDRLAFAFLAGPAFALGTAYVVLAVVGRPLPLLATGAGLWLLGACFVGASLWPRFCRLVLRREPDAEWEFGTKWRAYRLLLAQRAEYSTLWDAVVEMARGATYRMTPLVKSWFVSIDLGPLDDVEDRFARLWDRQRVLLDAYRADRWNPGEAWPNADRPTEGTRLELGYPELEALVAVATAAEQRRIVAEAGRFALAAAGILDARTEDALLRTAQGDIDRAVEGELVEAQEADEAVNALELPRDEADPDFDRIRSARRRTIARIVAGYAFEAKLSSVEVAEVVYGAARTCLTAELDALRGAIAAQIAPERVAEARPVEVDQAVLAESRRRSAEQAAGPFPSSLRLSTVAAIGFVAGVAGTLARVGIWPFISGNEPVSGQLSVVIAVLTTGAVAWILLALAGARPAPSSTTLLFFAAYGAEVAEWIVRPSFDGLLARVAPGFYATVFEDRTTSLPYGPLHGVLVAAVFVTLAWVWNRDARARERARAKADEAQPRSG